MAVHPIGGYERRFATVAFEGPQGLHHQRVQLLSQRTVAAAGKAVGAL